MLLHNLRELMHVSKCFTAYCLLFPSLTSCRYLKSSLSKSWLLLGILKEEKQRCICYACKLEVRPVYIYPIISKNLCELLTAFKAWHLLFIRAVTHVQVIFSIGFILYCNSIHCCGNGDECQTFKSKRALHYCFQIINAFSLIK